MVEIPRIIEENLNFLIAEIDGQLADTGAYFDEPSAAVAQKVMMRAGYAENLRTRVHNASQRGRAAKKVTQSRQLLLQNLDLIGRNLDLLSRVVRRSLIHAEDVQRKSLLRPAAFPKAVRKVRADIASIVPALETGDSRQAVAIGQGKARLDTLYDQLFRTYVRDMRKSKHIEDLANALLAANEFRRIGDALQGTSEAILSINLGQTVQFERYFTLRSVLSGTDMQDEELELEPLAETRSGSAISAVRSREDDGETLNAVFKDGELQKVREERAGVKSWHSIYPGLAPKILSYKKRGRSAALLIEHIHGHTFEHILLNESDSTLENAQKALSKTLRDIWKNTWTDEPARVGSMGQLGGRLKDVRRIHPYFGAASEQIGGLTRPAFDELVARAAEREKKLPAPFSVFIHGDFNLDNVIYDPAEKRIRFIDLHRSRYTDYVQDISVFMVSNYRLQIPDAPVRRRIERVASNIHDMASRFARSKKDQTFEFRLALGLARSFATSTRFTLDKAPARRMWLRSRFLLERALECPPGKENRFKLPIGELFRE